MDAGNHVPMQGLTSTEVAERYRAGQSNYVRPRTSRAVTSILRANIFTVFNAILTSAVVVVLLVGNWRDAIFGLVMVFNAGIGVFAELRSKRALDSVAVLEAPRTHVWRDGELHDMLSENLVCDDLIELRLGDQVPADGRVVESRGLEVDEAILTGESLPVRKRPDDDLLSGTAITAGSGSMLVEKIGAEAWAQKITAEAKTFSLAVSEIQQSVNKILRWITWALPVVAGLLYWSQQRADPSDWRGAMIAAVAGIVGMIPQGLVLLTSMNFGIAAATLARRGVLVQELPAVEILARVDTLCLDKTGTLTTGGITGRTLEFVPGWDDPEAAFSVLHWLTEDRANASADAVQELLRRESFVRTECPLTLVPFSSARKWSAAVDEAGAGMGGHTWVLGAPEILLANAKDTADARYADRLVAEATGQGNRVLCLSCANAGETDLDILPQGLSPVLIVTLEEEIRPDASRTLQYFRDQGVSVVVISGDSVPTVTAIAEHVGMRGLDTEELIAVDARTLPDAGSGEFAQIAASTHVFGRVSPDQKRDLIRALRAQGRTVAMTGDGVNDALALKEADLGIAMGNAAGTTKAVSRMILMNGQFAVLPGIVAEGRRIIANMERVSSLFLSKTTYAMLLAVVVSIAGWAYPFLPRHLTYIGWFTIGTPAFFLALGSNTRRYLPGFLRRTLLLAVPSGLIMGTGALAAFLWVGEGTPQGETAATLTLIMMALWLLSITARPVNGWRALLLVVMASGAVLGVIAPLTRTFFALQWPTVGDSVVILVIGVVGCVLIEAAHWSTSSLRDSIGREKDNDGDSFFRIRNT